MTLTAIVTHNLPTCFLSMACQATTLSHFT